jgi:hypothetical protein
MYEGVKSEEVKKVNRETRERTRKTAWRRHLTTDPTESTDRRRGIGGFDPRSPLIRVLRVIRG